MLIRRATVSKNTLIPLRPNTKKFRLRASDGEGAIQGLMLSIDTRSTSRIGNSGFFQPSRASLRHHLVINTSLRFTVRAYTSLPHGGRRWSIRPSITRPFCLPLCIPVRTYAILLLLPTETANISANVISATWQLRSVRLRPATSSGTRSIPALQHA